MGYTYHDWREQATDALRLARLRLHMTEVAAGVRRDVASDGKSWSTGEMRQYLADLAADEARLEARTRRVNGGLSRVRFGRAM